MSKLSILIITKNYPPIRATHGRLAYDLARRLMEQGHEVKVITKSDQVSAELENNIFVYRVSGVFANTDIKRLAKKLKRQHLVISLTSDVLMLETANYLSKKLFAKHIQWVQEMYPEMNEISSKQNWFQKIFCSSKRYFRAQKLCDHFVVPGRTMNKKLKNHHILPQRISYIPNWTNLHGMHLEKMPKIKTDVKTSYDEQKIKRDDSPKFRIIHAGNLRKAHPVDVILGAAEILQSHAEIEFIFIGDENAHLQLGEERGVKQLDNVRFVPYQPTGHYQNILESGDLHLVTLRPEYEGLLVPCKFYSSLTVARPVIFLGPKESEIGQVMQTYECGRILEEMSSQKLADAILEYRNDGQVWFTSQDGATNAAQEFNPTNSLEQWEGLIHKVAT